MFLGLFVFCLGVVFYVFYVKCNVFSQVNLCSKKSVFSTFVSGLLQLPGTTDGKTTVKVSQIQTRKQNYQDKNKGFFQHIHEIRACWVQKIKNLKAATKRKTSWCDSADVMVTQNGYVAFLAFSSWTDALLQASGLNLDWLSSSFILWDSVANMSRRSRNSDSWESVWAGLHWDADAGALVLSTEAEEWSYDRLEVRVQLTKRYEASSVCSWLHAVQLFASFFQI